MMQILNFFKKKLNLLQFPIILSTFALEFKSPRRIYKMPRLRHFLFHLTLELSKIPFHM